jgi:hypothetical protein
MSIATGYTTSIFRPTTRARKGGVPLTRKLIRNAYTSGGRCSADASARTIERKSGRPKYRRPQFESYSANSAFAHALAPASASNEARGDCEAARNYPVWKYSMERANPTIKRAHS